MNYTGSSGILKVDGVAVAEITAFSLAKTKPITSRKKLGDAWDSHLANTVQAWSGKLSAHWDEADATGQSVMRDALLNGARVELSLYFAGTGSEAQFWQGFAYIEANDVEVSDVDAMVSAMFSFRGDGQIVPVAGGISNGIELEEGDGFLLFEDGDAVEQEEA